MEKTIEYDGWHIEYVAYDEFRVYWAISSNYLLFTSTIDAKAWVDMINN